MTRRPAGARVVGTFNDYKLRIHIEQDFEDVTLTPQIALNLINECATALTAILNDAQKPEASDDT